MFSHSKGFFSSLCNASHYFLILLSCWKFWGFRRLRGGQAWILKRRHNQATLPRPRLAPADHRSQRVAISLVLPLRQQCRLQLRYALPFSPPFFVNCKYGYECICKWMWMRECRLCMASKILHDAAVTVLGSVPTLVRSWKVENCAKGLHWTKIRWVALSKRVHLHDNLIEGQVQYCSCTVVGTTCSHCNESFIQLHTFRIRISFGHWIWNLIIWNFSEYLSGM